VPHVGLTARSLPGEAPVRPHILIVQDDRATRESLSLMLNAEGYVVDEATDGNAALARSRSGLPLRLVILDLQMSGMDGWQFLCARQREPALAAVPVLVLTAARGIDGPGLRALGAKEVLEKPAATEDVVAAVRHYCPAAAVPPEPARESLLCAAPHGHENRPRALGLLTVVFGLPGVVGLPLSPTAMRVYARRLRKAPPGFAGLAGKVAAQKGARAARLGAALSFGGLVGWGIAALLYFLT
jgi:CheY-like chemotaxis protein